MTAPARRILCLVAALEMAARPGAADEPGAAAPALEEPALAQQPKRGPPAVAASSSSAWRRERGPRFEVSWRTFDLAEMAGRRGRYHTFQAEYFFLSSFLRLGAGLEGGFDTGQAGNFLMSNDLRLGAQWPARITPSLDAVLGLGLLRINVLHDNLVCFAWQAGLEASAHFFVTPRLFLSAALGWRRLVYRQPGNDQVQPLYIYNDTLSIRVGIGL